MRTIFYCGAAALIVCGVRFADLWARGFEDFKRYMIVALFAMFGGFIFGFCSAMMHSESEAIKDDPQGEEN